MADKAWKQFERDVADVIGGKRHWANSGESVDVESARFLGQCKLVKKLSLEQLTQLVEAQDAGGVIVGKIGFAAVKVRRGPGRQSPTLFVFTKEGLKELLNDRPQGVQGNVPDPADQDGGEDRGGDLPDLPDAQGADAVRGGTGQGSRDSG